MIKITIPGRPVPKGRPRLGVRGRRAYIYTPERTKQYEQAVGLCARAAVQGAALECPVAVPSTCICTASAGSTWTTARNTDGMNKIVYEDDNQVVDQGERQEAATGGDRSVGGKQR